MQPSGFEIICRGSDVSLFIPSIVFNLTFCAQAIWQMDIPFRSLYSISSSIPPIQSPDVLGLGSRLLRLSHLCKLHLNRLKAFSLFILDIILRVKKPSAWIFDRAGYHFRFHRYKYDRSYFLISARILFIQVLFCTRLGRNSLARSASSIVFGNYCNNETV